MIKRFSLVGITVKMEELVRNDEARIYSMGSNHDAILKIGAREARERKQR